MMPRWAMIVLVCLGASLALFWTTRVQVPQVQPPTVDQTPDLEALIDAAVLTSEDTDLLRELERTTEAIAPDTVTKQLDDLDHDLTLPDVDLTLDL